MSVALDQPTSSPFPFADFPPAILELLRDEANLSLARQVLESARQDCLTRQQSVQANRPTLGFLAGKKHREDYSTAMAAVVGQLTLIEKMLSRVSVARERTQPTLRLALASYLSETDALYRQGLRAGRFHDDWHRAYVVLVDRLKAFLRDTRQARNAMSEDVRVGRPRHSSETHWRLSNARSAAAELERAINDLNKTAHDHASAVATTPFAQARLPSMEMWRCIDVLDTLMARPPAVALPETDQLLAEYTELKESTVQTLEGMFKASAGEQTQMAEAHLQKRGSELLTQAEAHLVTDAELEPTLADIEKRQNSIERQRLAAQFPNRPFSAER
jgi:hypothetical protein